MKTEISKKDKSSNSKVVTFDFVRDHPGLYHHIGSDRQGMIFNFDEEIMFYITHYRKIEILRPNEWPSDSKFTISNEILNINFTNEE